MAKTTTTDWLIKLLPIFILAGGMIAGWVRLDTQLEATIEQVAANRAERIILEQEGRDNQIAITEIKGDVKRIDEKLDRLMLENRTSTEALLTELRKLND